VQIYTFSLLFTKFFPIFFVTYITNEEILKITKYRFFQNSPKE